MTLHQGQGHRSEHGHIICHVYCHAKFEWYSLNTVRDIAIIVQVKMLSSLRRSCDLVKIKVIGLRIEYRDRYLDYLHSKVDGHYLEQFLK